MEQIGQRLTKKEKKALYDKKRYQANRKKKKAYMYSYYRANKEARTIYSAEYQKKNKKSIAIKKKAYNDAKYKPFVDYKRTLSCEICGISGRDRPEILDFHHKDPSKKKFPISIRGRGFLEDSAILKEIRKCIILCSNCHRTLHAKIRRINDDQPDRL